MSDEKVTLDDLKSIPSDVETKTSTLSVKGENPVVGMDVEAQMVATSSPNITATTTSTDGPKEVAIGDIREYKKPEPIQTVVGDQFNKLHAAVDKEKDRIDEVKAEAYAKLEDIQESKANPELDTKDELGSLFADSASTTPDSATKKVVFAPTPANTAKPVSIASDNAAEVSSITSHPVIINKKENDFLDDFASMDDSYEEEDDEKKEKEKLEQIKKVVSEKITAFDNPVDLSTFTISKKVTNTNKLFSINPVTEITADWMLYSSKKPITMSALTGSDIQKMDTSSNNKNPLNAYKEIYHIIFNHIIDPNKPDFESWLKTTRFADDSDIFFAAYMATFSKSHSIPYTCTTDGCEEVFMADLTFEDLVKYQDDATKEEVMKLRNKDISSAGTDQYNVSLHQISDDYVVALRNPSLYDVLFEPRVLDSDLVEKYIDLIGLFSYIDTIYYIATETKELIPINTYPDANNTSKTAIHKYREFYKILSTLNSDQQAVLERQISKIDEESSKIKYILPEVTCPKCGSVIAESEVTPLTLLFMRHRVAKLAG